MNLFLGSDVSSLPSDASSSLSDDSLLLFDDSTSWPVNSDNSSLDQLLSLDQTDNIFGGETEPFELAEVNDLCAADENILILGKMRARDESSSSSCPKPGSNTNQLKLPDWNNVREKVWRVLNTPLFGGSNKKDDPAPLAAPPLPPVIPNNENENRKRCPGDYGNYVYHLCCETYQGSTEDWRYKYITS